METDAKPAGTGTGRAVVRQCCATCRHAVINSGDATGPRDANRNTDNWANRCRWCIHLFEDRWEARDGEVGFDMPNEELTLRNGAKRNGGNVE